MTKMEIQTGRWYGPDGQKIRIIRDGNRIAFMDDSRCICGTMKIPDWSVDAFMRHYDTGKYEDGSFGQFETLWEGA